MAITGLSLCGFLVAHLAGNCLIFAGEKAFNTYGHMLITHPLIYPAEAVLLLLFLTHIILAAVLTWESKRARPHKYAKKTLTGRGATLASSTMPLTGSVILIFLIFHLWHFKFGPFYRVTYDGEEMRDLHRLVVEYFQNPWAVLWYGVAMAALGLHLSHGFWSAFQSFGLHHPGPTPYLRFKAKAFALLISGGFLSLPLYCYFGGPHKLTRCPYPQRRAPPGVVGPPPFFHDSRQIRPTRGSFISLWWAPVWPGPRRPPPSPNWGTLSAPFVSRIPPAGPTVLRPRGGSMPQKIIRMMVIRFGVCSTIRSRGGIFVRERPMFTVWPKFPMRLSINVWPKGSPLRESTGGALQPLFWGGASFTNLLCPRPDGAATSPGGLWGDDERGRQGADCPPHPGGNGRSRPR